MAGLDENHEEGIHATRDMTVVRKARVAGRKPEKSGIARVFVTPEAAAKLLKLSSGAVSHSHMSLPIPERRKARKARKRLLRVSAGSKGSRMEMYRKVQEGISKRHTPLEKTVVGGAIDAPEEIVTTPADARISTAGLRHFARDKLHSSSILREILKAESDEIGVEEFLGKLPIWLHLFKRDIGE